MKKPIAIIGYGRFGRFAALHLKKKFTVYVADKKSWTVVDPGITRISIHEVSAIKNILLAVPIHTLPSLLHTIADSLQPGTLVCDVCSVKEQPIRWMKSILPKHVSILGTHPLFGPDSASKSLAGRTIVLCPIRVSAAKLNRIKKFFRQEELIVRQMTPRSHDRLMASTLFLTQFVGRAVNELSLPSPNSSTTDYRSLHHIASSASRDTKELFRDMFLYNRYSHQSLESILRSIGGLSKTLRRPH